MPLLRSYWSDLMGCRIMVIFHYERRWPRAFKVDINKMYQIYITNKSLLVAGYATCQHVRGVCWGGARFGILVGYIRNDNIVVHPVRFSILESVSAHQQWIFLFNQKVRKWCRKSCGGGGEWWWDDGDGMRWREECSNGLSTSLFS